MIYTVTINPSVDYYTKVKSLLPGNIHRANEETVSCGGKGINVSRVLSSLGCPTRALGVTAGHTGNMIKTMLDSEGVDSDFVHLHNGQSRICVKIRAKEETDINGVGPMISQKIITELSRKLAILGSNDTVVLSGSLPAGLADSTYAEMIAGCPARIIADTTGARMRAILAHKPYLIKPNESELAEMCGAVDARTGAHALHEAGAQNVLVSLGARGAYLLCGDDREIFARSSPIEPVDTTCAGDSMLAGFLAALHKGSDFPLAMRIATAAGTAACLRYGPAQKQDILRIAEQITVWEDKA